MILRPDSQGRSYGRREGGEGKKVERAIRMRCLSLIVPMVLRQPPSSCIAGFDVNDGAHEVEALRSCNKIVGDVSVTVQRLHEGVDHNF